MVEIELDGQKVEVPEGSMVMHAAEKAGVQIPHFCYHKKLSIAANCRMCLVDVEKAPKPLPACATPVTQGMIVRTQSEKAIKAQEGVMEFLLINHPLDCPICDQGGECQLQDLAVGYGKSSSRYNEEKRVVFHKNVGPLISMEEMSRCIHCTRCVRFGQEIAGVMELGMTNRGEHSEITTFLGKTVDSELSGNMIDICPVGALTSKPFRYRARTWELARRKSVSPHDSTGTNIIVQVKNNEAMRVVPYENEEVNECWIADRDRFSYEALNSPDRLTTPMIKQGGQWQSVDWNTALEYVANGLKQIKTNHGAQNIGALVSDHSTVEELYLAAQVVRGLGSDNIDYRLRHTNFDRPEGVQWLGTTIDGMDHLEGALIVGSFLRKDHPLFAARLRHATKHGARIAAITSAGDDWLIPLVARQHVAPRHWIRALADVAAVVAEAKGVASPVSGQVTEIAQSIASSLLSGERKAILLGNAAAHAPDATHLLALAQWIGDATGASVGYLTESANTVGAQLVKALPQAQGLNAGQMLTQALKAYLLLNVEPEFDSVAGAHAIEVLNQAEMVVALTSFKSEAYLAYADVLLPIAPFTETSGTFVSAEGRVQSFVGVVKTLGESRPAWKVLRVLGNLLGLNDFGYETSEEVKSAALGQSSIESQLSNRTSVAPQYQFDSSAWVQRVADLPIYQADPLVRRAPALQATADAKKAALAHLPSKLWNQLGLKEGESVVVEQGGQKATLSAKLDPLLPDDCVRVPMGTSTTAWLNSPFGPINVQRA